MSGSSPSLPVASFAFLSAYLQVMKVSEDPQDGWSDYFSSDETVPRIEVRLRLRLLTFSNPCDNRSTFHKHSQSVLAINLGTIMTAWQTLYYGHHYRHEIDII